MHFSPEISVAPEVDFTTQSLLLSPEDGQIKQHVNVVVNPLQHLLRARVLACKS